MSAIHTCKEANLNMITAQLLTRKVLFYQELLTRQGEKGKYFLGKENKDMHSIKLNKRQQELIFKSP